MSFNSNKISVTTATIIGMNAMIGSGIFSAPATMAANVGPAGIIAYGLVVVAVWFMALSFARLAYLFPQEGSFYTYVRSWAGHYGGIIACGSYLLGFFIAMGLLCQMAGMYLQSTLPTLSASTLGFTTLIMLVALNAYGVTLASWGQKLLIVCTVFPLLATIILCIPHINLAYACPFFPFGFTNVLKATRVVIFGFFGFECATALFPIVEHPTRNVPRALTYAIGLVGLLYTLFIAVLILSTPLHYFSSPDILVSDVLAHTFPTNVWLVRSIHLAIVSAIIGTIHAMIWSSSMLLRDFIKVVHAPVNLSQRAAVGIVGVCIALSYSTISNLGLFFNLTALFVVSAYLMAMIALLVKKEEWRSGHNYGALIGCITALMILVFALEGLLSALFNVGN